MIDIFTTVAPVISMLLIGIFAKKIGLLTIEGVTSIKGLITNIVLPVAIFNALLTADYSSNTIISVGTMLAVILVTFLLGFACKLFVKNEYSKYLPFMVSVYEGGMMAYPLYTSLCGSENLSKIAVFDIAGLLFGFSIYMGMLTQTEAGVKAEPKTLFMSAIKTPAFIAAVLGIIFGLTPLNLVFTTGGLGQVFSAVVGLVTAPLSAMILVVLGFDLNMNKKYLRFCSITIVLRFLVQAVCLVPAAMIISHFYPGDKTILFALIMYMAAPATFSMQTFVKKEDTAAYISTTNSIYCLVTIFIYVILAFVK